MVYCFDVVSTVLNEIPYSVNSEKLQQLEQYCSLIDDLCMDKQANGSAYEVTVDQISLDISITLTCYDFDTSGNKDHAFLKASDHAKRMCLYNLDPDESLIEITFTFDGVWDNERQTE